MWSLIKEILTSPAGSFASVFAVFIFIIWAAVKAGSVLEKYKLIDKMESTLDKIKDDMSIVKAFMEVAQRNSNPFAQSQSPINLNKKGVEVSNNLKAKEIINSVWDKISSKVSGEISIVKERNSYSIQEICFKIGKSYSKYFSSSDMDRIKTVAYDEGVDLSSFDLLFGIEIRNRYFLENKIGIEEIDKHDPAKKSE